MVGTGELTGTLDEVQVAAIRDRIQQLRDLDKRREAILKSLTEMGKLTPELEKQINEAETRMLLAPLNTRFEAEFQTCCNSNRNCHCKEFDDPPPSSHFFEFLTCLKQQSQYD